jgi:hypothetical protein
MAESPEQFYNNRNFLVHSIPNGPPVTSQHVYQFERGQVVLNCGATITCDTRCMTWSNIGPDPDKDGNEQLISWFLFTHDFQCMPTSGADKPDTDNTHLGDTVNVLPTQYRFRMRWLNQYDTKLLKTHVAQALFREGIWDTLGDSNTFSQDGIQFKESYPGQTPTLDNYSRTITETVGANAGFFGSSPNFSFSASESTSSSHSWSVPSVSVSDDSKPFGVDKTFHVNTLDARSHTFEMTVQHLVMIVDDKKGMRDMTAKNARFQFFDLQIWPEWMTDNTVPKFLELEEIVGMGGLFMGFKSDVVQGMGTRQIVRVRAPPLPKGVEAVPDTGLTTEEAAARAMEQGFDDHGRCHPQ